MGGVRQARARVFIAVMAVTAVGCLVAPARYSQSGDTVKFLCYLLAALLASPLKVSLPGIEGTLSVNFLFTLLGILELSLPQTLFIGLGSTLTQCNWRPARRPKPVQLLFNLSQVTVSSTAAYVAYQFVTNRVLHAPGPVALVAAAATHFAFNTVAMSAIIGLTEDRPVFKLWKDSYLWLFPYFMGGAAVAGLVSFLNRHIGWQSSLLVLPPIYLMYRSYRLYLGDLESEKRHAQKVSNLHLRTVEALALAIEAKDQTTGDHLQRVRVYAMEVARELGLSEDETEALRAASVLHDIGKLAVPESIISKPGKLTPDEFEKMKIHPVVGAEILGQVDFPYPVVPIVLAHHEKWDGSGYPSGLKGEEIPIGARILMAVDCLDALASDRQYRKALPLDEAMAKVASESGTSFDPQIVEILAKRYVELERMANEQEFAPSLKLSTDIKIERGVAPDAGFADAENSAVVVPNVARSFIDALANARQEEQRLFEMCSDPKNSFGTEDVLALLSNRVKRLLPQDSTAVFLLQHGVLIPAIVSGENFRQLSALRIPLGAGLTGWVAENCKSIVNGNPAVETAYVNNDSFALRSALATPIKGASGVIGVLALYRSEPEAFTKDDLDLVETLTARLGVSIERGGSLKSAAAMKAHA